MSACQCRKAAVQRAQAPIIGGWANDEDRSLFLLRLSKKNSQTSRLHEPLSVPDKREIWRRNNGPSQVVRTFFYSFLFEGAVFRTRIFFFFLLIVQKGNNTGALADRARLVVGRLISFRLPWTLPLMPYSILLHVACHIPCLACLCLQKLARLPTRIKQGTSLFSLP